MMKHVKNRLDDWAWKVMFSGTKSKWQLVLVATLEGKLLG